MKCIYLPVTLIILGIPTCCNKDTAAVNLQGSNATAETYEGEEVLARVNGVSITNHDVSYSLRGAHGQIVTSEMKMQALEKLVEAELIYQKGREVGLHRDSKYRNKVLQLELSLRATRRAEMMKRVYNMEVAAKAEVSLQETRDYFDTNRERISRRLQLGMIPFSNESDAGKILAEIRAGKPFEVAAGSIHPDQESKGRESWDLGLTKWSRLPLEWHDVVYSLEPGEVSAVFVGEQTGIRIFKLLAIEEDLNVEFSSVRNAIMNRLRDRKTREYYREYLADLKRNATIERISSQ